MVEVVVSPWDGTDVDGAIDVNGAVDVVDALLVVLDLEVTGYVFPGSTRHTRTVRNPSAAIAICLIVLAVSPLWSKICLPCILKHLLCTDTKVTCRRLQLLCYSSYQTLIERLELSELTKI